MPQSFVGSLGTLIAESGLAEVKSAIFGRVSKMLSGKKFPQNMRVLRLVEELLSKLELHAFESSRPSSQFQ